MGAAEKGPSMANGNLTAQTLERLREPGRHSAGSGLYLQITPTGTRSWLFRFQRRGRRHEMGFGPFPTVTLAAARQAALETKRLLHRGEDPLALRRAERAQVGAVLSETFDTVAEAYIVEHAPGWKHSGKSAAQWRASLATYAKPHIGTKPVREVTTDHILDILRPIWATKSATATRVRGRIEVILDAARVRGLREGENPARWKGHLALMLPAPARVHKVKHHAALPARELPSVIKELSKRSGTSVLALQFVSLTACRASEALGATWDEIDLSQAIWTIPAERIKAARPHRVPLSKQALAIVREASTKRRDGAVLVFPGQRRGRPLSLTSLMKELHRCAESNATVHGLRSTFRDWCADRGEDRDLAEVALAHAVGDSTERAYARSDLLERRRKMMQRWADFTCSGARSPRS